MATAAASGADLAVRFPFHPKNNRRDSHSNSSVRTEISANRFRPGRGKTGKRSILGTDPATMECSMQPFALSYRSYQLK